jgi:hypothetical protein
MGVAGFFFARNDRPAARVSPTAPRHKHSEAEIQRSYGAPPRARRRDSRLHRLHMSPAKRLYEPPIFEGRVMLPEVQEQIYEEIIQFERMEYVGPQMRELILDVWPELAHKLPPEDAESPRDEDQTRSPPLPLWHSNADLDPDAVFSLPIFGGSFGLCRSRSVATVARLLRAWTRRRYWHRSPSDLHYIIVGAALLASAGVGIAVASQIVGRWDTHDEPAQRRKLWERGERPVRQGVGFQAGRSARLLGRRFAPGRELCSDQTVAAGIGQIAQYPIKRAAGRTAIGRRSLEIRPV